MVSCARAFATRLHVGHEPVTHEALRAYFTEDLTVAEAGARPATPASSMASLLRDFRAGKLELFAPPGKPGPKTAPAKDRARARVIELRRAGPVGV